MYDMGSKLKEIRLSRGMTQKELANKIGRSKVAISSYETNQQVPPTEVLVSICEALHVPITYFVEYNCKDTYSSVGLSPAQKELIDLLFKEMSEGGKSGDTLTVRQIEIVKKLILIFTNNQ